MSTAPTRRRRFPPPYPTADTLSPNVESGPLEPAPLTAPRMAQEPPEAEIRPRTRHGIWYVLGLIRAGWARGWPTRLAMLAAALALVWFVLVPTVVVALAHLGYIVALLAGIYGGSWLAGKVLGPVPAQQALQELLLLVLLAWVLSLAAVSRLTYRLTRRQDA